MRRALSRHQVWLHAGRPHRRVVREAVRDVLRQPVQRARRVLARLLQVPRRLVRHRLHAQGELSKAELVAVVACRGCLPRVVRAVLLTVCSASASATRAGAALAAGASGYRSYVGAPRAGLATHARARCGGRWRPATRKVLKGVVEPGSFRRRGELAMGASCPYDRRGFWDEAAGVYVWRKALERLCACFRGVCCPPRAAVAHLWAFRHECYAVARSCCLLLVAVACCSCCAWLLPVQSSCCPPVVLQALVA
eukprot:365545-Chlamydomonas_euryale.AAC.10